MVEYNERKIVKQGYKLNQVKNVGVLYLVATPIGNLSDITIRALDILKSVDIIACEDTRITSRLLGHYNIKKPLIIYNDHSDTKDREKLLEALYHGKNIALISDAGSPLIADPGYKLIRYLKEYENKISVIPGPCSLIAALSVSGISSQRFLFCGFLNKKSEARKRELEALCYTNATMIFFVAARELLEILQDMLDIFGDRDATVARELTKIYEESRLDNIASLINFYRKSIPKGEIVLIVSGNSQTKEDLSSLKELLERLSKDMTLKDAVSEISKTFDIPKREVYKLALELKI